MNRFFTRLTLGGSIIVALLMVAQIAACAKDKPCKGIITVLDASNNPIAGIPVTLTAPAPSTTSYTTSTDASGRASFEVNLPQILDISVGNPPTPTGKVVRFEQGKTDEVTVTY